MIGKKYKDIRISPYLDSHDVLKSKLRYVYIRIVRKGKPTDISVYLENGVRLKVLPDNWKEGNVYKGTDVDEVNSIRHRIHKIRDRVYDYIVSGGLIDKATIEINVYGIEFINNHKKKRTAKESIPVIETQPSDYLKELWKEYPRQKFKHAFTLSSTIDTEGFVVFTTEEIETIKDQISLDDFPYNLPRAILPKLIKEFERDSGIKLQKDDTGFMKTALKYYLREKLFDQTVTNVIEVDKEIIQQFKETQFSDQESYHEQLVSAKIQSDALKAKKLIESLSPEKRFEEGYKYIDGKYTYDSAYFDNKNIIHLLALCRFGKKYNEALEESEKVSGYDNIWKSILDYWINGNPSINVKDFDIKWVNGFLRFMAKHGHIKDNHKFGSNPFNLDKEEYINKNRQEFAVSSFSNLCKWIRDYITQLALLRLIDNDFSKNIKSKNYHQFHAAHEYEAKNYILPKEFMAVFNARKTIDRLTINDFFDKIGIKPQQDESLKETISRGKYTLYQYALSQKIMFDFDKVKEILIRTSHLFTCQTLLGALRISDFNDTQKTKFRENQSNRFIRFNQRKTKGKVQNDILRPVEDICKNFYNGELPPRYSGDDYNKYLKLLFSVLGLNRPFIDSQPSLQGGYKDVVTPLNEVISNKFARATFVALMTANGMPDKEIMKWTGHKSYTIFLTHYQPILEDSRLRSANAIVDKVFGKYKSK